MNWEKTVDTLMGRGPAAFGLRAPGTRRLAVLAYHAIEEPRLFARHLDYVQRHMQPVALGDVVRGRTGSDLPPRAVLITFDDGDRSVLEVALPLLVERGLS